MHSITPLSRKTLILILIFGILIAHQYCSANSRNRRKVSKSQNRISGGFSLIENEHRSFIGLYEYNKNNDPVSICSGVAITKQLVLTAAYCFPNNGTRVFAAASIWHPQLWTEKGVKTYEVEKFCRNPSFDRWAEFPTHDFQVLRLKEPIPDMRKALLPSSEIRHGNHATMVGVGVVDNTQNPSLIREKVQGLLVYRQRCSFTHPTQMCFESYDLVDVGNACLGDEGAPVYGKTNEGRRVVLALVSKPLDRECKKGKKGLILAANIHGGLQEVLDLVEKCAP